MNEIIQAICQYDFGAIISALDEGSYYVTAMDALLFTVLIGIGILFGVLGHRLMTAFSTLLGIVAGVAGGLMISRYFQLEPKMFWGPALILVFVLGLAAWNLRWFTVPFAAFISVSAAAVYVLRPTTWAGAALCLAGGFVSMVLAVRMKDGMSILSTSLFGGLLAGASLYYLLADRSEAMKWAICGGLAIGFFAIQFFVESKKRKRDNLKRASKIRETKSTENEVEKARAFVDDIGEGHETDDIEERHETDDM